VSSPGASHLLVSAAGGARQVDVTITPGRCGLRHPVAGLTG